MSALATRRRVAASVKGTIKCFGTTVLTSTSGTPVRYTDTTRQRIVVQNPVALGVTLQLGFGTVGSQNAPGSFPITVPSGSQYRDETPGSAPLWAKDSAGGQVARVPYYVELTPGFTTSATPSGVVETIPSALPLPSVGPTTVTSGGVGALWMTADGATLYGGRGVGNTNSTLPLSKSTDDGANWTTVHTFTDPTVGLIETADGEALVSTYLTAGALWKSSGWSVNPATATWSKVLDSSGTGCFFRAQWGLHQWSQHGSRVLVSEYGSQTVSPFTAPAATKVWISNDYGATFTLLFDLAVLYPSTAGLHIHSSAIQQIGTLDRLWIAWGDGGTGTTPNPKSGIAYSDDLGANWTIISNTNQTNSTWQSVTIVPLRDCILLLPDGWPHGIHRIPIDRNTGLPGSIEVAHLLRGNTGTISLGYGAARATNVGRNAPLLLCIANGSSAAPAAGGLAMIVLTYDGYTFVELYRDLVPVAGGQGFVSAFGPTASGKVVAHEIDGRQSVTSRVTFTLPALALAAP